MSYQRKRPPKPRYFNHKTATLIIFWSLRIALPAEAQHSQNNAPIKICLIQDKSSSGVHYGTPSLIYNQIIPFLNAIDEHGGELGFGVIDDSSNWPLHRYYASEIPTKPEVKEKGQTPAEVRHQKKVNQINLISWMRKKKERASKLEQQRHKFKLDIEADLNRSWDAPSSDIYGSVFRCDLFLNEATPELSATPTKYLIVISDAEHNTNEAEITSLSPGVKLIIVNGRRWEGSLSSLSPETFEGISAAFRFVLSNI